MKMKTAAPALARWGMLSGLLYAAVHLDSPFFLKFRTFGVPLLGIVWGILAVSICIHLKKSRPNAARLTECAAALIILAGIGLVSVQNPVLFKSARERTLNTSPRLLWDLGRHFIVGYRDFESIERLVSRGAVGGVYIARRNIMDASAAQIKQDIDRLQAIQRSLGLPPLFIASDQEGGLVSRLSPPLTKLPPLSHIVRTSAGEADLYKQVIDYASVQAKGLSRTGINLNLSPVVDLKKRKIRGLNHVHSRIFSRAISDDPQVTAGVATVYCKVFEKYAVIPTLKHFPGLGNVFEDTHFVDGEVDQPVEYLEQHDWIPFRQTIARTTAFMMLGHVRVNDVDPSRPASLSGKVIRDVIRNQWNYDGVLITDDMNMGPVYHSGPGIGGAAVQAMNAGADLLLLSYDGDQYYKAMTALLAADRENRLNRDRIHQSGIRLNRALQKIHPRLMSRMMNEFID